MRPKTDYAYIAGLIDGEGCIQIEKMKTNRVSPQYQLKIQVNMTSLDCIKKLQGVFGGKFYSRKREGTNYQSFNWVIFSKNCQHLLKKCLPYFQEKKQQAIAGIEFQNIINHRKLGSRIPLTPKEIMIREKYYKRLKELKTEKLIPIASKGLP